MSLISDGESNSDFDNRMSPIRIDGVREYKLGDELLLYTPDSDDAHVLNTSAMAIWKLCDGNRTVDEIIDTLAEWLEQPVEELSKDIIKGFTELHQKGLLELE